jgi:iron complex outermembrane receptor protein
VAEQDRVADFELPTDDYTLLGAFVSVRPPRFEGVTLFLEGRNLGDVEAREHASFLKDLAPLPGRSVRAGVAYRF